MKSKYFNGPYGWYYEPRRNEIYLLEYPKRGGPHMCSLNPFKILGRIYHVTKSSEAGKYTLIGDTAIITDKYFLYLGEL